MKLFRRSIAAVVLAGSVAMIPTAAQAAVSPSSTDAECQRKIALAARYDDLAQDAREDGNLAAALRYYLAEQQLLKWIARNCIELPA